MIIRILGGNGAGKSYIVHQVIRQYEQITKLSSHWLCERNKDGLQNVMIPGHYRIANGGMDTIPSGEQLDRAYFYVERCARAGWHVLYEVSAMKDGPGRLVSLVEAGLPARAILLRTSDDDRVASVRTRGHNIREDLIRASGRKAEKTTIELSAAGIPICIMDRAAALAHVLYYLRGTL